MGSSDEGDGRGGAELVSAANAWRLGLGWSAGFTAARSSSPRSGSRGGDAAVGGDCGEGEEVPGSAPIAEICGPPGRELRVSGERRALERAQASSR